MTAQIVPPAATLIWRMQSHHDVELPRLIAAALATERTRQLAEQCASWNGTTLDLVKFAEELIEAEPELEEYGVTFELYRSRTEPVTRIKIIKEG